MKEMSELKNKIIRKCKLFCTWFFIVLGVFFFVMLILSFTAVPYFAYRALSMEDEVVGAPPNYIVVLGGSGMPSPDGLIRTYYAAEIALRYSSAKIIIALPYNEDDSLRQLNLMAQELIIRGVDSLRILFEPLGFNTYSQAQNIAALVGNKKTSTSLLIVSSPVHLYRAIKTFRKLEFAEVAAFPAFDSPVDEEKIKDKENTTDTRIKNLDLRYNMWSYLNYELIVMREYCAITYYKLKGWI